MDGGGGTPRPELLTVAKKSQLGCLISFQLPMGFQNLIEILIKIRPLKKYISIAKIILLNKIITTFILSNFYNNLLISYSKNLLTYN